MSKVSFPAFNIREWFKTLPSIRSLDWRVGAAAALAVVALGALLIRSRRNLTNRIEPLTLQTVKIEQLGFAAETLQQKFEIPSVEKTASESVSFAEVGAELLAAIQHELTAEPASPRILINFQRSKEVLRLIDCGLSKGTYKNASEKERELSWVHMILQKLKKRLIADFNIGFGPAPALGAGSIEMPVISIERMK
jgi:hypothetical protein